MKMTLLFFQIWQHIIWIFHPKKVKFFEDKNGDLARDF